MSMGDTDLGRVGIWTWILDNVPSSRAAEITAEAEELGYGATWYPEAVGRDPFVKAAPLLGGTSSIKVATGIAFDAGADHGCVQVLADGTDATVEGWRILAPHLLD